MLRELRKPDLPEFTTLTTREFPEEAALLGIDPVAQGRIIARAFRPEFRFLLGMFRFFGRPLVRFFVVEAEGRVAATAVLSFSRRSGYIGAVTVDPAFRRRGFGKQVLAGCATAARAAGKEFVALDVIRTNTPAMELYRSVGYLPLRSGAFLKKELARRTEPLATPRGVRPFRRSDRKPLADIVRAGLPEVVAKVLPVEENSFALAPLLIRFLESETAAWVIDDGAGPVAFFRSTVSHGLVAGNITSPVLSPDLPDDRAREFLEFAESWVAAKGPPRVVVERWDDRTRNTELLRAAGFAEAIPIEALYLPLHA